jgi:phosphoribosylamine--glycine ligase
LVIGSGGREHALCLALRRDPAVTELFCAPGNAGIAKVAELRDVEVAEPETVAALAQELAVDLVVIGPELPLVKGAADAVRAAGIACFGPSAAAARIEGSKSFAKDVMVAAGVPTARSFTCTTPDEVAKALADFGPPYVVKDDGLAAGKGVVVTDDRELATAHAARCERVVIEEHLDGPEVSLFCVTDGVTVIPLEPAQDFKRLGDGDTGPNTGGMGAYSPLPWLSPDTKADVVSRVAQPVIDHLREVGTPFAGLLYVGLAITQQGPMVIEFNARFGDPETQVVLARLQTPLGGLLLSAATGTLADHPPLEWSPEAAVAVVVSARGYPESPITGDPITGTDDAAVLHAGTSLDSAGALVSSGGRVLTVLGRGTTLAAARKDAYVRVNRVYLPGGHFRTDIAQKASRS